MRFLRYGPVGKETPVVMNSNDECFVLPASIGDIDGEFWENDGPSAVQKLLDAGDLESFSPGDLRIGAPIAKPEKLICIGLNYIDHAKEMDLPIPEEPIVFMKAPNAMIGPHDDVYRPRGATKMDWEIELAVIIGKRARYLDSPDDAPGVMAGFSLSNDVTERAFMLERGGTWVKGKSCETFNPLGPWVATPDEIPNPQDIGMRLSVNNISHQDSSTKNMIFPINHLIWYLSQFMVLEPGDVVNTGSPSGVSNGHDDVPFLEAGDVIHAEIDGLGTHEYTIVQA